MLTVSARHYVGALSVLFKVFLVENRVGKKSLTICVSSLIITSMTLYGNAAK
jgi:uncharacterized membrane protein YwaF